MSESKIPGKIRDTFLNLKIGTRIMLFYFVLLIFSIVLSSVLYQKIYSSIMSSKVSEVSLQTLYSINSNIDSMIENSKNLSKVIIANDAVQKALNGKAEYTVEPSQSDSRQEVALDTINSANLDAQRSITAYVSGLIEGFPFISSIYIFDNTSQRYGIDKQQLKSLRKSDISLVSWYQDAVSAKGGYILRQNAGDAFYDTGSEKYISLIRVINDIDSQKPIGMLILNISENSFTNSYTDIINKYDTDIMIVDRKGQSIVNFRNFDPIDTGKLINNSNNSETGSIKEKIGSTEYLISYLNIRKYEWRIFSVMPFNEISKESGIFSVIAFGVIAMNSLFLFIGSIIISRMITIPLKKLLKSMKGIEKGEFKKVDIHAGKDEIGKLRDGYNIMITEIQNLIERLVEDQKMQRKAELEVLQAQIKPHFLYNTFDAISSLALSGKNAEVYKVMKALGSYYRASLNKGNEVITIGEEIEIVRNYLTIQQVRYGDVFSVNYDVDERTTKVEILKLVLQPLVENALYHGIKPKGENGIISVTAKYYNNFVILTIEDDGVGMDEEKIKKIMNGDLSGKKVSFGLWGTIERLRIFYNDEDLFSIESRENAGTKIIINIPVKGENQNA